MLRCRLSLQSLKFITTLTSQRKYASTQRIVSELDYRGFISDLTMSRENFSAFLEKPRVVYCGLDPTAESLHVGNLLPLLTLLHFQLNGHHIIALLGGATGLVGDPSGRDEERPLQPEEKVQENTLGLRQQLDQFFGNAYVYAQARIPNLKRMEGATVVNNLTWWRDMSFISFLHSSGKLVRISNMLSKESVKKRIITSNGISFAEFSYQLLQAYDFWHLYRNHNCRIQVGGSDQWGNILAGLDMITRGETKPNKSTFKIPDVEKAVGITTPILTSSSGQKFGKSAGNAIWLHPQKTSVFDFYQFFLRTSDADVEKYLKLFTLLSQGEIVATMRAHEPQPELRLAQRQLASEITSLVHGEASVRQAETATKLLFDTHVKDINPADAVEALRYDPRYRIIPKTELLNVHLTKLAVLSGLTSSRADAVRLVASGGLYLNNIPVGKIEQKLQAEDLIANRLAILRAGKDKHVVLALA